MAISDTKFSILTFPQYWDGASLRLRVLVIPRENPLQPLVTNVPPGKDAPAFANAKLKLNAMVIPSLDAMPSPSDVTLKKDLGIVSPTNSESLFKELEKSFKITKASNVIRTPSTTTRIQKYLPQSYRNSFAFSHPRTPFAKVDDSYHCAMMADRSGLPKPVYSTDDVSWGKVFAMMLRQPQLAQKLGFIYEATISIPENPFKNGGWLYVDLDSASDYYEQVIAKPEIIKRYAARIPALSTTTARVLFSAVQFPVSDLPVPGNYDPLFVEAEEYDDGFAKIVHSYQPISANMLLEPAGKDRGLPPVKDYGIRLGWDDEQLLIWQNRQVMPDAVVGGILDSPLGVLSYRVDVRKSAGGGGSGGAWNSLAKVLGDLVVKGIDIGHFEGELGTEVAPNQLDGQKEGLFWLPPYFTQWMGASLVLRDEKAAKLSATDAIVQQQLKPVDADKVPLRYGDTYDFRVRLADITGGGPAEKDERIYNASAPISSIRFRRFVPPMKVLVTNLPKGGDDPANPQTRYTILRPLLTYPSLLFTGLANAYGLLLADMPQAIKEKRETGYFDPDVASVLIEVDVRAPKMDSLGANNTKESYYTLFSVTRDFPTDPTQPVDLNLVFQDANVIKFGDPDDLGDLQKTTDLSPIYLPTSRDIRIRLTPICRPDPTLHYFGTEETRVGRSTFIYTRANSKKETDLFGSGTPDLAKEFQSIMLQPDPVSNNNQEAMLLVAGRSGETQANLMQRLANQLNLDNKEMTLLGKPGQRTIFGCAKEIRHTLAPDHSSVTFASAADLLGHWIPTIMLDINRDWSWDGLELVSFEIKRNGTDTVGTIEVIPTVSVSALDNPQRNKTRLVFFDAVDPKKFVGPFPKPMELRYTVEPHFKTPPSLTDPVKELKMTVPVAVAPAQVPKIVSAGIALSPYERSADYSSTGTRRRVLWFEFAEPVQNPDDAYFVFVKAYAPDSLLLFQNTLVEDPKEDSPFIDPELIRVITPNQSDDKSGLNAKQILTASEISNRHFIVPLPAGMDYASRELFGFFVYEICVGHANVWSTAQSRFGRPIRVTGVQHPAPPLVCTAARDSTKVMVTAPYATPVFEGAVVLPAFPNTELWGVLYAQVIQADGKDYRNILLDRRRMFKIRSDQTKQERANGKLETRAECMWTEKEIQVALQSLGLPEANPLSVLCVELIKNQTAVGEPIGGDLGTLRIYRTSQLEPVPQICYTRF